MKTAFTFMIGLLQMHCPTDSYNEISSFWLRTQEESIKSLFHYPIGKYKLFLCNCL